jgi:hypothetical protein
VLRRLAKVDGLLVKLTRKRKEWKIPEHNTQDHQAGFESETVNEILQVKAIENNVVRKALNTIHTAYAFNDHFEIRG